MDTPFVRRVEESNTEMALGEAGRWFVESVFICTDEGVKRLRQLSGVGRLIRVPGYTEIFFFLFTSCLPSESAQLRANWSLVLLKHY